MKALSRDLEKTLSKAITVAGTSRSRSSATAGCDVVARCLGPAQVAFARRHLSHRIPEQHEV
ncbi:protein of unknown function [Beijerinckiaceae bacterium RH AL1]|nr:hypothetical protein [Beijerinckiaceae bacterium]VVB44253.1 protein of unknown function [Beijerinckiaceae bacterium RH CH11]VVB44313.1 protein of unknown function [Beijerinckiaceae bacterium RH AL8]VVC54250.1 protein of unknown function [Beijerinckiaceae bacterium RH AL1]